MIGRRIDRILLFLASVIVTGASAYVFRGCEAQAEIKGLERLIALKDDTLMARKDTLVVLRFSNAQLRQSDSLHRFFIGEKERLLLEMRDLNREANLRLKVCERWRADAEDDGVITPDTVIVRRRWFGRGFKVVK